MGYVISSRLDVPFKLTGPYVVTVTDDTHTAASVTLNDSGTTTEVWYRMSLAKASGTGTETDPKNFFAYLNGVLPLWVFSATTDGKTKVTYNGDGTPNGAISFSGASLIIRNLLGFTGNISGLGAGGTTTATQPPAYVIHTCSRMDDSDVSPEPGGMSTARLDNGTTYAFYSSQQLLNRTFTFGQHPRDATAASALSHPATVVWPPFTSSNTADWSNPPLDLHYSTGTAPIQPFPAHHSHLAARGRKVAWVINRFQDIVAGTFAQFEVGYYSPETLQRGVTVRTHIQNYDQLLKMGPITLTRTAIETF